MDRSVEKNYKFSNVTDKQIKAMGVQALANRPNAAGQYGQAALSAEALKLWFDKLATLLASKINEIQDAISGEDAAKYIGLALENYKTLDALIAAMQDGRFADQILKVFPRVDALEPQSLQSVINGIAQAISELEENKLDKQAPGVLSAYTVGADNENGTVEISEDPKAGAMPKYNGESSVATKNPTFDRQKYEKNELQMPANYAMNYGFFMSFMQEMSRHIGAGVKFTLDPTTYKLVVEVVNVYGQVIWRDDSVDLPLEQMIVGVRYEDGDIVITLNNGESTRIPVATMVGGLASDEELNREIGKVNARLDTLFEEYVDDINELVGGDYADYS
jgi:hypothetical protein